MQFVVRIDHQVPVQVVLAHVEELVIREVPEVQLRRLRKLLHVSEQPLLRHLLAYLAVHTASHGLGSIGGVFGALGALIFDLYDPSE
jgi:hypothetical protein